MIRGRVNLKLERLPFPFDVAWFSAPISPGQRDDLRFQAFSRGGRSATLYPSWDDRLRVGLSVPSHEASRLVEAPKTQLLGELGRVVGEPYASFFLDRANDISDPSCSRFSSAAVLGTLLLGDAAHPMSPVRAQGINLALRDAIVAANYLVPALASREADAFDRAAGRIQREREPEIIESQRLQVLTARPPPPARSAVLRATVLPRVASTWRREATLPQIGASNATRYRSCAARRVKRTVSCRAFDQHP